ncbi:hypothetical protein OG21DRAFT_1510523 [Imleria badia]|nr:hypothetical protein OG21DRAFT_1510523 [Imleria badia]
MISTSTRLGAPAKWPSVAPPVINNTIETLTLRPPCSTPSQTSPPTALVTTSFPRKCHKHTPSLLSSPAARPKCTLPNTSVPSQPCHTRIDNPSITSVTAPA